MREVEFNEYLKRRYSNPDQISTVISSVRKAEKMIGIDIDEFLTNDFNRILPKAFRDKSNPSASRLRSDFNRYREFLQDENESKGLNIAVSDNRQGHLASDTNRTSKKTNLQFTKRKNPSQSPPYFATDNSESERIGVIESTNSTLQFSSSRNLDSAQIAETITDDFYNDRFDLSGRGLFKSTAWSLMPEVEAERQLSSFGVSGRSIRIFMTLISAMDRARDATSLWRAGTELFKRHPEVFDPDCVLTMSTDTLTSLLREGGVSQRHTLDTDAWQRISRSLESKNGAVFRLVETGYGDALELLKDLRSCSLGQARYPMLRGPKIGPMWVRIMVNPGGAVIDRIDSIPVAVDVQVRRATENLGVSNTVRLKLEKAKPVIQSAWRNAARLANIKGPSGIEGTCAALDPALWFFGKYGCSHCEKMGQRLPISSACQNCRFPVLQREP